MAQGKSKGWRAFFNIDEPSTDTGSSDDTSGSDALQALAEALSALDIRVTAIETSMAEAQEDIEVVKDAVDTPEFAQLRDNLTDILGKFGKLDKLSTVLPSKSPRGDKNKRFTHLV